MNAGNVVVNRPTTEPGLAVLESGGDFADGAIAYERAWLGGETFVSFDENAVTLLSSQGEAARVWGRVDDEIQARCSAAPPTQP